MFQLLSYDVSDAKTKTTNRLESRRARYLRLCIQFDAARHAL